MFDSVTSYIRECTALAPLPWLILGKGPSAERLYTLDTSKYYFLSLNHACRLLAPTVAHFVDIEAYKDCATTLEWYPKTKVCLPWYPHVKYKSGRENLQSLNLDSTRFVSYNSTTSSLPQKAGLPLIRLKLFSAVAAFNILGYAGVRTVYSLGVDGGNSYAHFFDKKDKLANGRKSFDDQLQEIYLALKNYGMTWKAL